MPISVYNTMTRQMEPFQPLNPDHIKMYACGVTVYDLCHIGHAMQAIIYDVIRNYFEFTGAKVTYVRNFTDVDDKIIERAKLLGLPALEHSENMIQASARDLALLDIRPADIQPKVSEHIPEIIAMVEKLIQGDFAYAVEGDVYFRVRAFEDYGKLSNRSVDDMLAGARMEPNPIKADPVDFALWKAAKPGEVSWPSPWGEGRPGWHIECSAMALKYLGETFDIHGGGKDLIFPHHENEIAQSCCANAKPFANYWIHNGLVTVEGRKMSKSFDNFMTIQDAVAKYHPEAIRYTILSHLYTANIDFSEKAFYDSYQRLIYFYTTLEQIDQLVDEHPDYPHTFALGQNPPPVAKTFNEAMSDNFNTAIAIREIGQAFKWLNDLMAAKSPKIQHRIHALKTTADTLRQCASVLGLFQREPERALSQIQDYLVRQKGVDLGRVRSLVSERIQARKDKNWGRADEIRDELSKMSVQIKDTGNGTDWLVVP